MADPAERTQFDGKPPIFRINLSLPPSERYVELATLYCEKMRALRSLFDELLHMLSPKIPVRLVHYVAWLALRRLHNKEETEELRGISRVTGIRMYFLVSLNTVLDLLMGCTSGGVRASGSDGKPRMLHFRTLDWDMEGLRDLIVQLEFVRSSNPDKVLATSITYAGYVGILTGVRKDLSASLNFRPVHDTSNNFSFYTNHLLVLLGFRQSISSILRQCILPSSESEEPKYLTLSDLTAEIPGIPTTAAYFVFCDGSETVTMEKDNKTATIRSSSTFIVVANHDQEDNSTCPNRNKGGNHFGLSLVSGEVQDFDDLMEESRERQGCMQAQWDAAIQKHQMQLGNKAGKQDGASLTARQKKVEEERQAKQERDQITWNASHALVTGTEVKNWLTTYPVVNESTHFTALLDPEKGKVAWVRRYHSDEWSTT